jgi:hypothetical protein
VNMFCLFMQVKFLISQIGIITDYYFADVCLDD